MEHWFCCKQHVRSSESIWRGLGGTACWDVGCCMGWALVVVNADFGYICKCVCNPPPVWSEARVIIERWWGAAQQRPVGELLTHRSSSAVSHCVAQEESYRQEVEGVCMWICVYVEEYKRKTFLAMKVMAKYFWSETYFVPDKTSTLNSSLRSPSIYKVYTRISKHWAEWSLILSAVLLVMGNFKNWFMNFVNLCESFV